MANRTYQTRRQAREQLASNRAAHAEHVRKRLMSAIDQANGEAVDPVRIDPATSPPTNRLDGENVSDQK